MEKVCPICGKPTSSYMGNYRKDGLCRYHATLLKDGQLRINENGEFEYLELPAGDFSNCILCEKESFGYAFCRDCWGKYTKAELLNFLNLFTNKKTIEKTNAIEETNIEEEKSKCLICGEEAHGKQQCKECYDATLSHMDSLDKNRTVRELRDYYYNLKERIFIINNIDEARNQCCKLIAIAKINEIQNKDLSLIERVYEDVKSLLIKKQTEQNPKYVEEIKEKDKNKSKINTAQDGHNVDSDMEVRIDDILYNNFILHSYGKNIDEIIEKRKKCDWFIPIANGEGIYLEYWGMDKTDYIESRKEKEELYKKYDIPYIGIEKDDPKQDTQTFTNNLLRDLRKLATEKFGFMPKWKK